MPGRSARGVPAAARCVLCRIVDDQRTAPGAWRRNYRRLVLAFRGGSGPLRRGKLFSALALFALIALAVIVSPDLDLSRLSDWSASMGWAFPVVFVLLHAAVTVTPVPRTLFTLAAGVLFGPVLGLGLAVLATMISAFAAFAIVRAIGREAVERRLTHPMARAVEARLDRRGWLAVGSLRMIGFVPFFVVNYCSAVSAVRLAPYLLATLVGILPGTISVVLFGDVLNTGYNPVLLAVSAAGICVGLLGLVLDARLGVDIDLRPAPAPAPASGPGPTPTESTPAESTSI